MGKCVCWREECGTGVPVVGNMGTHIPKPSRPSPNGSTTDLISDGWRMDGYRAGKSKRAEDLSLIHN